MTYDVVRLLKEGNHSLVVAGRDVQTFDGRGVADLYDLLSCGSGILYGSSVADKVVGKGAAALMVLGGVSDVYAEIVSMPALKMLKDNGIAVSFAQVVPNIINRSGDGLCPVEKMCLDCLTAADCLPLIRDFMCRKRC